MLDKKQLKKQFYKIVFSYILMFTIISCLRFLLIQVNFLHYDLAENLASKIVRSFDLIPLILLSIPYLKKRFYDGVLKEFSQSQNLTIPELINQYHLNREHFKKANGDLFIKITKQNVLLK